MGNTKKLIIAASLLISSALILFSGCEKQGTENIGTQQIPIPLSELTDIQKIGQIFCVSIDPIRYYISPEYKNTTNIILRKYKPGAVYLSTELENWKQETLNAFSGEKLLAEIHNMHEHSGIPLLIGADFETGAWHWDRGATRFSYPLALGATQSTGFAYRQAKIIAAEAKAQGINWIFTPVVNTCEYFSEQFKIRCFGNDYETVGEFGRNFVIGYQETGLASSVKYFPLDTLITLSDNSEYPGLLPFSVGIEAGALSVMCSPLDAEMLSTVLSRDILRTVLHDKLGFNGLVVGALTGNDNEAVIMQKYMPAVFDGLKAGYTMIILPEVFETTISVIDRIVSELDESNLDMSLIDAASEKVLALKNHMKLYNEEKVLPYAGTTGIGLEEYHNTARNITDASVTLVKNDGGILPFDYDTQHIVMLTLMDESSVFEGTVYYRTLTQTYENIKNLNIVGTPDIREKKEIMRRVSEADVVLCSFFIKPDDSKSRLSDETIDLINNVLQANNNVAAVSFNSPYLINKFPGLKGYIATYSPTEYAMKTVTEIIFEKRNPVGKLPVNLSDDYPAGLGLQYE